MTDHSIYKCVGTLLWWLAELFPLRTTTTSMMPAVLLFLDQVSVLCAGAFCVCLVCLNTKALFFVSDILAVTACLLFVNAV